MKSAYLRGWKLEDLQLFKEYQLGDYLWKKFDGPYYGEPTEEELEARLSKIKKHIENPDQVEVTTRVIASKIDDKLIGSVNHYYESKETNWISLGISIFDQSYWGKGVGTEIFREWTTLIFQKYPEIVRLGFMTWSGNHGMMQIGEKLEYKLEARFRKARIVDGKYFDSIGYGILRDEWKIKVNS